MSQQINQTCRWAPPSAPPHIPGMISLEMVSRKNGGVEVDVTPASANDKGLSNLQRCWRSGLSVLPFRLLPTVSLCTQGSGHLAASTDPFVLHFPSAGLVGKSWSMPPSALLSQLPAQL